MLSWLLLWSASAWARCPEPGEVRLLLLYPLETAAASAAAGVSIYSSGVMSAQVGLDAQTLRWQQDLCGWTLAAELRGDLIQRDTPLSPALGATASHALSPWIYVALEGLVGTQGRSPMVATRLRLSRPRGQLTPFVRAESRQVISLDAPALFDAGWSWQGALGLGYGVRSWLGVGLSGTLSSAGWGGELSVAVSRW